MYLLINREGGGLSPIYSPSVHPHLAFLPLKITFIIFVLRSKAMSCMPATSVHTPFLPTHFSGQKHACKWSCPASQRVASEHVKGLSDWCSDQASLSAASWSLVWASAIRSHAEIMGNADRNNPPSL